MNTLSLFDRHRIGTLPLKNRIVMAPMTRARALQPGNIPSALMAEYYRQRGIDRYGSDANLSRGTGVFLDARPAFRRPDCRLAVDDPRRTSGRRRYFFSALARGTHVARPFSCGWSTRGPLGAGAGRPGLGGG